MTNTQRYAVWLKGFLDACGDKPTEAQTLKIKDTLNSIFEHVAEPVVTNVNIRRNVHPAINNGPKAKC